MQTAKDGTELSTEQMQQAPKTPHQDGPDDEELPDLDEEKYEEKEHEKDVLRHGMETDHGERSWRSTTNGGSAAPSSPPRGGPTTSVRTGPTPALPQNKLEVDENSREKSFEKWPTVCEVCKI